MTDHYLRRIYLRLAGVVTLVVLLALSTEPARSAPARVIYDCQPAPAEPMRQCSGQMKCLNSPSASRLCRY